jgi:hypothetical protein
MHLPRRNLLLLAVLCGFLISCNTQNSVSEGIRNQLQSGATRVDMKGVATAFSWESLYVFTPYTSKDCMCKTVGVSPQQCPKANLRDADEGEFFLVFIRAGEITHAESISRTIANFDESERCAAVPIAFDKALFKVERKSGFFLVCE